MFWEILEKLEAWAKTGHSNEKATGNSLGEPVSWVGQESQGIGVADHVVGARLTVSDRAHSPTGPVSRGLREGTVSSVSTSVWEKTARDAGQLCSSPCIAGAFPSAAHAVELRGSGSEQIRAWALEEELPGTPEALCLHRPQSLMVFAARSYGTSLPGPGTPGWGSWCGAGTPHPSGGLP